MDIPYVYSRGIISIAEKFELSESLDLGVQSFPFLYHHYGFLEKY